MSNAVESLADCLMLSVAMHQHQSRPGQPWTTACFEEMRRLASLGLIEDRGRFQYRLTERGERYVHELAEGNERVALPEIMQEARERAQDYQSGHRNGGLIVPMTSAPWTRR